MGAESAAFEGKYWIVFNVCSSCFCVAKEKSINMTGLEHNWLEPVIFCSRDSTIIFRYLHLYTHTDRYMDRWIRRIDRWTHRRIDG